MAVLSMADQLTPLEVAKRFGSKDQINVIEALTETNEMLIDASLEEASDGTIMRTNLRTAQPAGTRRMYNEAILSHASQTKQVEDYISMLEDYSDVDADLADHSPSKVDLLRSEDQAFLNGMGITMVDDLVYGNHASDAAQINGLHIRYNALATGSVVETTHHGSSNNVTSLWLIKWGKNTASLFYPRGRSDLGIKRRFVGLTDIAKTTGTMPAYRTHFSVHYGLAVKDPRAVKRIANIDATTTGEELINALIALRNKMPVGVGNVVGYCNAEVKTLLDIYANSKANGFYTADDPWGRPVTMFNGIRIRQVDRILNTENTLA